MNGLTRDGTFEPVSRDQILRGTGTGKIYFSCSADYKQPTHSSVEILHAVTSLIDGMQAENRIGLMIT